MKKNWLNWLLAILITLTAVYFQRKTGPTYPRYEKIKIAEKEYTLKFLRTHGGDDNCEIRLPISDKNIEAKLFYKRYPTNEAFTEIMMERENDELVAYLPHQAPAGKLMYYIELSDEHHTYPVLKEKPVVIRFKGAVPNWVLIIHVILMFSAMFFSNVAGFFALGKKENYKKWAFIAFSLLLVGGMIFGPIMQKYAFGEYWAGFPNGLDLTDNKTLIAFVFWTIAILLNLKKKRPFWIVVASLVMLIINSIPHSFMGSELDYTTNEVKTALLYLRDFYG